MFNLKPASWFADPYGAQIASSWWSLAPWSNPAATKSCCERAAATLLSIAYSSRTRRQSAFRHSVYEAFKSVRERPLIPPEAPIELDQLGAARQEFGQPRRWSSSLRLAHCK